MTNNSTVDNGSRVNVRQSFAEAQQPSGVNQWFWAIITGDDGAGNYGWLEQIYTADGWQNLDGGRYGYAYQNPAREANGETMSAGDHVPMVRGYCDPALDWVYLALADTALSGGGGDITIDTWFDSGSVTSDVFDFTSTASCYGSGVGSVEVRNPSGDAIEFRTLWDIDGTATGASDSILSLDVDVTGLYLETAGGMNAKIQDSGQFNIGSTALADTPFILGDGYLIAQGESGSQLVLDDGFHSLTAYLVGFSGGWLAEDESGNLWLSTIDFVGDPTDISTPGSGVIGIEGIPYEWPNSGSANYPWDENYVLTIVSSGGTAPYTLDWVLNTVDPTDIYDVLESTQTSSSDPIFLPSVAFSNPTGFIDLWTFWTTTGVAQGQFESIMAVDSDGTVSGAGNAALLFTSGLGDTILTIDDQTDPPNTSGIIGTSYWSGLAGPNDIESALQVGEAFGASCSVIDPTGPVVLQSTSFAADGNTTFMDNTNDDGSEFATVELGRFYNFFMGDSDSDGYAHSIYSGGWNAFPEVGPTGSGPELTFNSGYGTMMQMDGMNPFTENSYAWEVIGAAGGFSHMGAIGIDQIPNVWFATGEDPQTAGGGTIGFEDIGYLWPTGSDGVPESPINPYSVLTAPAGGDTPVQLIWEQNTITLDPSNGGDGTVNQFPWTFQSTQSIYGSGVPSVYFFGTTNSPSTIDFRTFFTVDGQGIGNQGTVVEIDTGDTSSYFSVTDDDEDTMTFGTGPVNTFQLDFNSGNMVTEFNDDGTFQIGNNSSGIPFITAQLLPILGMYGGLTSGLTLDQSPFDWLMVGVNLAQISGDTSGNVNVQTAPGGDMNIGCFDLNLNPTDNIFINGTPGFTGSQAFLTTTLGLTKTITVQDGIITNIA
jgi:hypothetical protein